MSDLPALPDKPQAALAALRAEILALDPEKALNAILELPQAGELVRSLPEQDLLVLVHEIGPWDALPLLQLASGEQWGHLVDMEAWDKDQMDLPATTEWMRLLFAADPARMVQWFMEERTGFFELWTNAVLNVHVLDEHDDPSGLGDGAFTLDGTLYAHVHDAGEGGEDMVPFVRRLLEAMAARDFEAYQGFLLESSAVIRAEAQEEAFRERGVRLAEKGFLPFEEAVAVYQYLRPQDLQGPGAKTEAPDKDASLLAPDMVPPGTPFSEALALVNSEEKIQKLQAEFAALCNRLIVADLVKIHSREDLRPVVEKASGFVSMGLTRLATELGRSPESLVSQRGLTEIFRAGYSLALSLNFKAGRWRREAWFTKKGLPLSFWGEEWLGVLGGLLLQKPKYYDRLRTGRLYREFSHEPEIAESAKTLDRIMAVDAFLARAALDPAWLALPRLTWQSLVLTPWARDFLGLPQEAAPLEEDQARAFFTALWETGKKPFRASLGAKKAFLDFLARISGQAPAQVAQDVGEALEALFVELETEYGGVSLPDLDARYVPHLGIRRPG